MTLGIGNKISFSSYSEAISVAETVWEARSQGDIWALCHGNCLLDFLVDKNTHVHLCVFESVCVRQ